MMNISSAGFLITVLLMSGCATAPMKALSLTTSPYDGRPKAAPAKNVKITVLDFKLNTGKPATTIGEAKTGMFNATTPVLSDQAVNILVRDSIKEGLRGVGLNVVDPHDADYAIEGTVERFWVEEHATGLSLEYAMAHVKYDVYVLNARGESTWVNSIEAYKTSGKSMDATKDVIPTLTAALQESVRAFVEDLSFWNVISK